MITRGIVLDSKDAGTKVKVRLPLIHGLNGSPLCPTDNEIQLWASVLCTPGTVVNYEVGDIVLVAYEDYSSDKQLVLGHLASPIGKYVCAKLNKGDYILKADDYNNRHSVEHFPSYVVDDLLVEGTISANELEITSDNGLTINGNVVVKQGATTTVVDVVALQNKINELEETIAGLRTLIGGLTPVTPPTLQSNLV